MSTSEATPNGVANSSDQVGRHLADHPIQLSIAASVEPYYPYRGPLSAAGIEQLREGDFRRDRSAFRIEIGNDGWSWPGMDPLGVAQALIAQGYVGEALYRTVGAHPLSGATGQPDRSCRTADRRIVPDDANRDAIGIPRPRICRTSTTTTRSRALRRPARLMTRSSTPLASPSKSMSRRSRGRAT